MKKTIKYDKSKRWWFYEDGTRANRIISKSDNLIYLLNSDGTQTKVRKIRYNGKDRYVVEPNHLRKPYKASFILNVSSGIKNLFNGKKELGIMELNKAMHNPNFKITAGILGQFIPFAGNALLIVTISCTNDSHQYKDNGTPIVDIPDAQWEYTFPNGRTANMRDVLLYEKGTGYHYPTFTTPYNKVFYDPATRADSKYRIIHNIDVIK